MKSLFRDGLREAWLSVLRILFFALPAGLVLHAFGVPLERRSAIVVGLLLAVLFVVQDKRHRRMWLPWERG